MSLSGSLLIERSWKPKLTVLLVSDALSTWGSTRHSNISADRPLSDLMHCSVFVGVRGGVSPAILAHEGICICAVGYAM